MENCKTKSDKLITIHPETHRGYKDIVSLVLRSFKGGGTDYSDGTDIVALIEEIRDSEYYIPELSFFHAFRCQRHRREYTAARMIPTS